MKNALICTAAVLGLVFVGSADANAGVYGSARHYSYGNFTPGHSSSYYSGGHRSNYAYGNTHAGNGYYNSGYGHGSNYGYGHQNRGYRPGHGYSRTTIHFNRNSINLHRSNRYGH